MSLKSDLNENKIVLLVVSADDYNDAVIKTAKELSSESVCYVTTNKTFDALRETFKKNNVNTENLLFVDAITKNIKNAPDQCDGCYFVSSPSALTEISINVASALRHKFKYLVFDSITSLLVYQKKGPVTKFLSELINKIRASDTRAVFFILDVKEHEELVQEVEMFVDKTIKTSKTKQA